MSDSATLSVRLPKTVREALDRLAKGSRRSKSFLASEAIEAYVERELAIVEGVERGLADMAAGRTVSHQVIANRVRRAVGAAKSR